MIHIILISVKYTVILLAANSAGVAQGVIAVIAVLIYVVGFAIGLGMLPCTCACVLCSYLCGLSSRGGLLGDFERDHVHSTEKQGVRIICVY